MNQQVAPGGIEWTRVVRPMPDGTFLEMAGFTWNPVNGCFHGCIWPFLGARDPAECYAKVMAESPEQRHLYPHGFEHHYFHPERLEAPVKRKKGAAIFIVSMGDIFGKWIPVEHWDAVFDVVRRCPQHIFFALTKNPYRVKEYDLPDNVWVGVSSPQGNTNSARYAGNQLMRFMDEVEAFPSRVRWMCFEPLWFNCAEWLDKWLSKRSGRLPLDWAVIGAASKGRKYLQPDTNWTLSLLELLDDQGIPVFFKGNLHWSEMRAEFPKSLDCYPDLPVVQKAMF